MSEINVIEYQDELKRNRLKKYIQTKDFLIHSFIIGAQIPCIISSSDTIPLASFIIATQVQAIKQGLKQVELQDEQQIIDLLRNSSDYKDCQEQYQIYTSEVAKLIKNIGFKSVKEVLIYLQMLLESGYFAPNMKHQYQKFKNENELLIELIGARVLSGTSVCRHMASFFSDVLNELDYQACNMSVITTSGKPIKVANKPRITWNHSIVAVASYGEKILYDPTSRTFISKPTDLDLSKAKREIGQKILQEETDYVIINNNQLFLNPNRIAEAIMIQQSSLKSITYEEFEYLANEVSKVHKGNMHNQMYFYQTQEKRRQEIVRLQKRLCPYSDKTITEWKIK